MVRGCCSRGSRSYFRGTRSSLGSSACCGRWEDGVRRGDFCCEMFLHHNFRQRLQIEHEVHIRQYYSRARVLARQAITLVNWQIGKLVLSNKNILFFLLP